MTGTWVLWRFALRRDRILLPVWILGLAATAVFSVTATEGMYPTPASLSTAAENINATAALVALYGKVYDPTSIGALSLIKLTAFGSTMVAILFVFVVIRHSRAEEEAGRLELVGAGAVGRSAALAAAMLTGALGSIVLGVVTAVGLGLAGLPISGAAAFGLGWALSGIVFSAIAGLIAQLTTSARAAVGLGMAAVGLAYVFRAVGDVTAGDPGWVSWLSPIGWCQQIRPFAGDRWQVALLPLAAAAMSASVAFGLRSRRDLGFGLLPDRPGSATGRVGGALGLAWRLQRGMLAAWVVGAALLGLILGSIVNNVAGLLESAQLRRYLALLGGEQGVTDAFLAAEVGLLGAIVAAYAVAATARLRSEEVSGHVELLLSSPTARIRWAAGHIVLAMVGVAAILLTAGAMIGLAHGLAVRAVAVEVVRLVGACAAQIPAAWVLSAVVVFLFGWRPRWVVAGWGVLLACILLAEFGKLWQLPDWLLNLSPFAHSPSLPGGSWAAGGLALLVLVVAALAVAGLARWRTRDLCA
ncbi:MAG TPA: ABC transporter permease [Actinomycetota bacterium]|nr:ABC transporter permease [Actinomycetota bacterium]